MIGSEVEMVLDPMTMNNMFCKKIKEKELLLVYLNKKSMNIKWKELVYLDLVISPKKKSDKES
jgi:hypothetical protein